MKKQFVASLLAMSMVVSMLPLGALAEDADAPSAAEVGAAVDQAQESMKDAGASSAASGEILTAVDEALAAANEKLAQDKLDTAKDIIDNVNDENTQRADTAEKAEGDVNDAYGTADKNAEDALNANHAAQDALQNAEDAKKKDQAAAAAGKAEAKADEAQTAADSAQAAADQAAKAAKAAADAYEEAKIAAAQAEANAKQELEAGLISAETAEKLAKDAADRVNAKYEEMKAAQEEAAAKADAAKKEAEEAKANLKEASDKLADMVKDNTEEIAKDTADSAITGAALAASKVAVDIADKVVDAYEAELSDLQEQVDELDKAIGAADAAIAEANEKLAQLDADDAEYPKAKAALEAAEEAKRIAENEKAKADAIIANRTQEQVDQMTSLQDKVKDSDLTSEEGKQDVKDLTDLVLGYDKGTYGDIEWQDTGDGKLIFKSTTTVDGVETVQYYEVKKNEDGVLQYYKTDRKEDHTVSRLPDAGESEYDKMVDGKLGYDVVDADGNKINGSVSIKKTSIKIPFVGTKDTYTYEITVNGKTTLLLKDSNGYYYLDGLTRKDVTIEDPNTIFDISYSTAADSVGNSNSVTDAWANAEEKVKEAEEKLSQAETNLSDAKTCYDEAKKSYDEAKSALDAAIAENEENKAATEEQVKDLQEKIDNLNLKLNGNLADQVVRDALNGFQDGGIEGAISSAVSGSAGKLAAIAIEQKKLEAEKTVLEAKKLFGTATEEDLARLELLELQIAEKQKELDKATDELGDPADIVNTVTDLVTIIDHINKGEFTKEDLEKAVNLLGSTNVSAKTRQTLANLVESVLETKHDEANKKLQEAIAKAEEELANQGQVVADATKAALEAELAYADAAVKEAAATAAANHYEDLKNKADKAAQDAETARKAYEGLKDTVFANSTLLEMMKNAAENADQLAKDTQSQADAAKAEADAAKAAAEKAREIADKFPAPKHHSSSDHTASTVATAASSMSIAQYAYSLLGKYPGEMTNARFVEMVYAHFGIKVDLSSDKPQDVAKNGTRLERTAAKPDDITCLLSQDGLAETFGIYYNAGTYVFYNEQTHMVETGRIADAPYDWFPLRVTK